MTDQHESRPPAEPDYEAPPAHEPHGDYRDYIGPPVPDPTLPEPAQE
jgi:hypothetical protein